MRLRIETLLVALAVLGLSAAVMPAAAEVNISIDPGSIAFGYRDGYWDRDHHWHAWRNRSDADWYRSHYAEHYYDRPHGHEHEGDWRGDDRWWEHH